MKKRLLCLIVVVAPAFAQAGLPPCWPWYAEGVVCNGPTDSGCDSTITCATGWQRWFMYSCNYYDPSLGQFDNCNTYLTQCDTTCEPGLSPRRAPRKSMEFQADPLKSILATFMPKLEWKPAGRNGRCKLVRKEVL